LPDAAKTGHICDIGYRYICFIKQAARKVNPARPGEAARSKPEVRLEEAAEMTPRQAEPGAQFGFIAMVQRSRQDHPDSTTDQF